MKPVYAIQFLDYNTNIVKGFTSIFCKQDWDRTFEDEVRTHLMKVDVLMKHYVMLD
jgi:hypothetical protein